ncbi:MAG: hypothetical protein QOH23_2660, partial [Gaiellaceae bacterium]|nr:hypothetical protein [Gaiellaceae bacterium]
MYGPGEGTLPAGRVGDERSYV